MIAEIIPATPEHVLAIAPRMRFDDVREIWAASKATPHRALLRSLRSSRGAWTGTADGEPVCMFGISPMMILGDVGVPWLLGTDEIERHAVPFLRMSKRWVDAARADYRLLTNYVDARNRASLRWLKYLGFAIMSPEPYGPFLVPFHRFEMRA